MKFIPIEMCPKEEDSMANSVYPDQTAPKKTCLIRVYTVCPDLHVPIFTISTITNITLCKKDQSDLGLHCLPRQIESDISF